MIDRRYDDDPQNRIKTRADDELDRALRNVAKTMGHMGANQAGDVRTVQDHVYNSVESYGPFVEPTTKP